jgi:hypothetical protein
MTALQQDRPGMQVQMSYLEFLNTLIIVAIAVVPFLIWYLFGVILIVFGAIILAMLLRLGASRSCAGSRCRSLSHC